MSMRVLLLLLSVLLALAGCSNVSLDQPAPVVSRNVTQSSATTIEPSGPFAAHAGERGYYTVQRGDSLGRVAQKFGRKTHELIAWNQLDHPNVIEVGLVLRVNPPLQSGAAVAQPLAESAAGGKPTPSRASAAKHAAALKASTPKPAPKAASAARKQTAKAARKPASQPAASAAATSVAGPSVTTPVAAGPGWIKPVKGTVLQGFNGASSQGIDYAGKLGDPVLAAAPGKVVYAGSELRGYGNLVIIKHDNDYLSVYAHNDKLLVKDGQAISQGQQIATMGSSDASRVELHFEVRLRGKPIDPRQVLPH